MTARIVVVGSLNMDLVARAPHIPKPGETVIGDEFRTIPGGKGANQAVAASRAGGDVIMVGKVGCDAFGDELKTNLDQEKVNTQFVTRDQSAPSGVALIMVDKAAQNSILVASGSNAFLCPEDVSRASTMIQQADVLLLQLESPLETVRRAAEIAHASKVKVVLNPAPARRLPGDLLRLVDVLVPNETEASMLTGQPLNKYAEVEEAALTLLQMGVMQVIITLGSRGALLAQSVEPPANPLQMFPAFKVTPVDTTAAGDAFVGGLGVALGEGKTIEQAVRFGNACGAIATTRFGAQPSLPYRHEIENLLTTGS
ncbi:MAG TPA: ribokinase [Anaerolineaceae bacterium]